MESMSRGAYISNATFKYKRIGLTTTKAKLWSSPKDATGIYITAKKMIPTFKITPSLQQDIWSDGDRAASAQLWGYKYSEQHYKHVKLTEITYDGTKPENKKCQFYMNLIKDTKRCIGAAQLNNTGDEMENCYEEACKFVDDYHQRYLEPINLCRGNIVYSSDRLRRRLYFRSDIVYPDINIQLHPISPLRIASTSLTRKLMQRSSIKPLSGLITLNKDMKAFPIKFTDPDIENLPTIGIWLSGDLSIEKSPEIALPIIWANCARYLQFSRLRERVSSRPSKNAFLLIQFSLKPRFFEVRTIGECMWKTYPFVHEVTMDEDEYFPPFTLDFTQKQRRIGGSPDIIRDYAYNQRPMTNRTTHQASSPPLGSPFADDKENIAPSRISLRHLTCSIETFSQRKKQSSKQVLQQQTQVLEYLENQVKQLKAKVDSEDKRSMATAATNTTIHSQKQCTSICTSTEDFVDYSKRLPTLTDNDDSRELLEPITSGAGTKDVTYSVPLIIYESNSESSEDETILKVTKRYVR